MRKRHASQYANFGSLLHGLTKHPNIVVIPNPITIFENDYVSIEKKNYIVNVGRFIKSKNQRELIDIFTLNS